jgi:G patch domain-containing protein 1
MASYQAADNNDYRYWGTPIAEERASQRRGAGGAPPPPGAAAAPRAAPEHLREPLDAQGRRRFHGAFTGGFSAGHFNTVGSAEGWAPAAFRSSRGERAGARPQAVSDFLDDDERQEQEAAAAAALAPAPAYDTFGAGAAGAAANAAAAAARRDGRGAAGALPGGLLLPADLVAPVAAGVGVRLLRAMGWRHGRGVGAAASAPAAFPGGELKVSPPPPPKADRHGLGHDPFAGAEEFRAAKAARAGAAAGRGPGAKARGAAAAGGAPSEPTGGAPRRRGVAFGAGALDVDDSYGELEDYVSHEGVEAYAGEEADAGGGLLDAAGRARARGPRLPRAGLGDRLALGGYSFEVVEGSDEELGGGGSARGKRGRPAALAGAALPAGLLRDAAAEARRGLVDGFVAAAGEGAAEERFPPPAVPRGWRPAPPREAAGGGGGAAPPAPRAEPPADAALRADVDALALCVARFGPAAEAAARAAAAREPPGGRRAYLVDGRAAGAAYFAWKLHALRALASPPGGGGGSAAHAPPPPRAAPGRGSAAPLSADARGALLGEAPLPAGAPGAPPLAPAAPREPQPQQPQLAARLQGVAAGDRARLAALLGSTFVRPSAPDAAAGAGAAAPRGGLRPGAAPAPPRAAEARVVTAADLSRPGGGAAGASTGSGAAPGALPVRSSAEWRPAPLLCKRLGVADPFKGRAHTVSEPRSRTDRLALPDAVAAAQQQQAGAAAAAAALPAPEGAPPKAQLQQPAMPPPPDELPPPPPTKLLPPPDEPPPGADAGAEADAFLTSLLGPEAGFSGEPGGGSDAPAPPPARPLDLFHAIFEATDSEEEDDEEAEGGGGSGAALPLPPPAAAPRPAAEAGLAKLRAPWPPAAAPALAVPARAAPPAFDAEVQRRVEAALRALKRPGGDKEKRRKKERGGDKDKEARRRERRERKERRREER